MLVREYLNRKRDSVSGIIETLMKLMLKVRRLGLNPLAVNIIIILIFTCVYKYIQIRPSDLD